MADSVLKLTPEEMSQSLANLRLERDAVVLYEQLARIENEPERAAAFARIAANERRHADIWASRLESAGQPVPPLSGPRLRVRLIIILARVLGTRRVAELVRALEGDEEEAYASQLTPETAAIAADEREHAAIWQRLQDGIAPLPDGLAAAQAEAPAKPVRRTARHGVAEEAWHRGGRSGTLRAAVFGANDGLVSNLSLVMGVAGAVSDNSLIVLAGIAGLLAGAFSMAAGEYISMQSQRELFERQIAIEREEMRVMPEEELAELAAIYRAKGLPAADAQRVAENLMKDPAKALDTKVREELGLDPDELGSPFGAAWSSFVAFAMGAVVPLLPFLLGNGLPALVAALGLSFAALFTVGALVSLVTGRGMIFSGLRQVAIGAIAAAVTYAVGTLIGANLG
ncbi:MAG TPA: VIT1/CCC1 transporter family protein [Candidatus Limnocylindrales bacterium]|jgi:vacuolar iron transporter family protein|nr:VIT1/CCC1 transporter family protein [Candidatus Limnocylindrales bacterium]